MILNVDLRLLHLTVNFCNKQITQTLIRCLVLRCLILICAICQCPSTKTTPGFRIGFGSETTGSGFHIVNILLLRLTLGLISLVNDNHVDNIRMEILVLVHVYSGSIVNS